MNTVVLTGELGARARGRAARGDGWLAMQIDVRRRGLGRRREPGIITVPLLIPPELARTARQRAGEVVEVIGMLDIEAPAVDASGLPTAAVVAESIEAAA